VEPLLSAGERAAHAHEGLPGRPSVMDGCTVHVTLRVCAALEAAVARSFGPVGLEQLVVTAGTQLTVTNSGSAILQRLSIAHSVGAFVQAAVQVCVCVCCLRHAPVGTLASLSDRRVERTYSAIKRIHSALFVVLVAPAVAVSWTLVRTGACGCVALERLACAQRSEYHHAHHIGGGSSQLSTTRKPCADALGFIVHVTSRGAPVVTACWTGTAVCRSDSSALRAWCSTKALVS
jgi:hypothetical protein